MGFSRQKYWSGLLFPFPKGSSRPGDQTWVFCVAGRFFTIWATREAHLRSQCWIIFFKKRLHNDITLNLKILTINSLQGFNSVQFSHSVVSNSLQPHGPQHTRPPCPSPTPGIYPSSCPLSRWCHPTISSSVVPFSSCLQSFPASGSFQMSQLFTSGGQSIVVSASTSVLPRNTHEYTDMQWKHRTTEFMNVISLGEGEWGIRLGKIIRGP